MRIVHAVVVSLLVATLAAACMPAAPAGAPAAAPTTSQTTAAATTAPAAARPDTLIGAFDVGPGGCPQCIPYYASAGLTWLMKIWSPLVSWNKDYTGLAPQLATKWESNQDGTVWTFHLREGVKWHDGEPFTADDVKFTFELFWNPAAATRGNLLAQELVGWDAFSKGQAKEISGVKVIDDHTVELDLAQPDPRAISTDGGLYPAKARPKRGRTGRSTDLGLVVDKTRGDGAV